MRIRTTVGLLSMHGRPPGNSGQWPLMRLDSDCGSLTSNADKRILLRLRMTRIRQALAVALVATALCADRPAVAAPVERSQPESVATKLFEHLSVSFRR